MHGIQSALLGHPAIRSLNVLPSFHKVTGVLREYTNILQYRLGKVLTKYKSDAEYLVPEEPVPVDYYSRFF